MATFHGIGGIILALKAVKAALCAALEAVCKAWYKTKRQKRRTAFLSAALVSVFSFFGVQCRQSSFRYQNEAKAKNQEKIM